MIKEIFVLDVKKQELTDGSWATFIYGNPVQAHNNGIRLIRMVSESYGRETLEFVLPDNDMLSYAIIDEVKANEGVWRVNMNFFDEEDYFDDEEQCWKTIYVYKGL